MRTFLKDKDLILIAQSYPSLKLLAITYSPHITDFGIQTMLNICHDLQYMDFIGNSLITPDCIPTIVDQCQELRFLSIPVQNAKIHLEMLYTLPKLKLIVYGHLRFKYLKDLAQSYKSIYNFILDVFNGADPYWYNSK